VERYKKSLFKKRVLILKRSVLFSFFKKEEKRRLCL
jgi:hypothetical protein